MDSICSFVETLLPPSVIARNSGYSVDIYPKSSTKDNSVRDVQRILGRTLRFLRVGDQGHEFGNDFELLDHLGGFSVGTISSNPQRCFPVLDKKGAVISGTDGTFSLLSSFEVVEAGRTMSESHP
jgi:hypothetical protein